MSTETVYIGNDQHEVEVKPLTLLCKSGDFHDEITVPGRFKLNAESTLHHADRVQTLHRSFYYWWWVVMINDSHHKPPLKAPYFPCVDHLNSEGVRYLNELLETDIPCADKIRGMSMGARHAMGLIDLVLKLSDSGIQLHIQHPESFLHPRNQSQLAEFFVALANGTHNSAPLKAS